MQMATVSLLLRLLLRTTLYICSMWYISHLGGSLKSVAIKIERIHTYTYKNISQAQPTKFYAHLFIFLYILNVFVF